MSEIHSTMTLTRSECEDLFPSVEKIINKNSAKNSSQAYVVLHTDKGEEYDVLRSLSHIPEVREADVVFGFYDVFCKYMNMEANTMTRPKIGLALGSGVGRGWALDRKSVV